MNFEEYLSFCEEIVSNPQRLAPYDDEHYFNYAKLNVARMKRWLKVGEVSDAAKDSMDRIVEAQEWIVITEPWCGDAAHIVPFIAKLAKLNPKIQLKIELRDSEPFRINEYLTNGSKAIPIWIVKNSIGEDQLVWGPRPEEAQQVFLFMKSKGAEHDEISEALQRWYNEDKGRAFMEEAAAQFNN